MHTRRLLFAAPIAALVLLFGSVAPASADHASQLGHWARSTSNLNAPAVCLDGVTDPNLVRTAIDAWSANGYPLGWYFGICPAPSYHHPTYHVSYDGSKEPCHAYTELYWDAAMHTSEAFTVINDQGCSSDAIRLGLMTHEAGHAIGLGHTANPSCVMHTPVEVAGPCPHDRAAAATTYAHRW